MKIVNDSTYSWINELTPKINKKSLQSNEDCEWLIIGASYTGLSTARKLGELYTNQKIILVDAQLAGEGAMKKPVKVDGISKSDMKPQKSLNG